jgi:hypothetical protein
MPVVTSITCVCGLPFKLLEELLAFSTRATPKEAQKKSLKRMAFMRIKSSKEEAVSVLLKALVGSGYKSLIFLGC